jgi:hypothetical protein
MSTPLDHERERLPQYRNFCELYGLEDFEQVVTLYDIDELRSFLPDQPSQGEKVALQKLVGTTGVKGYMDYVKSNNTFELIMQWQEATGNHGNNALFFSQGE